MSTLSTQAQVLLVNDKTAFIEKGQFILVQLEKPGVSGRLIVRFVGACDDCPEKLNLDDQTPVYFNDKPAVDASELKLNTTYTFNSISYNKTNHRVYGIKIATNY
jgi:hypothetical protein